MPIKTNALHVKIKIDELPITESEIAIDSRAVVDEAFIPIIIAASTLAVVTSSRFGARL